MKIFPLQALGKILSTFRHDGKTIVQCHGCFDMLHIGHLKHLRQATYYGDALVVTVTSDKFVGKAGRPIFNEINRAEMLAALECVDYVAISDYPDASTAISIIKPDYFAKGIDYADKGVSEIEREAVKQNESILVFTTTEKYSTTEIIEKCKSV